MARINIGFPKPNISNKVEKTGDVLEGVLYGQGFVNIQGLTLTYSVGGDIESIEYDNGRKVTFNRDGSGDIVSYTDDIYTWSIIRSHDVVTGISVS
jgi:hypothetical protein